MPGLVPGIFVSMFGLKASSSLRAQRSNPSHSAMKEWIASLRSQ
jgi:hypothetical protein